MTRKLAMGTMKPPLMRALAASGAFYLRAATPKLPWKAKMAILMVGTGGHPGNVGLKGPDTRNCRFRLKA